MRDIKFTQSDASPIFNNGRRASDLSDALRTRPELANEISPIEVIKLGETLFSLDNRRLLAFKAAGIEDIPIKVAPINSLNGAQRFFDRFDPIDGLGLEIATATSKNRASIQQQLFELGRIKGVQLGRR